jgi:hypothetical protein
MSIAILIVTKVKPISRVFPTVLVIATVPIELFSQTTCHRSSFPFGDSRWWARRDSIKELSEYMSMRIGNS